MMQDDAVRILDACQLMTISTLRPDGWPQSTIVGYANDQLTLYFMIFRTSQKFANIANDNRVSVAVGREPQDISEAKAVFAGCRAAEVTDPVERARAWDLLTRRHPNLKDAEQPDYTTAALMRANCQHISVLDYTLGLGHADALHLPDSTVAAAVNSRQT